MANGTAFNILSYSATGVPQNNLLSDNNITNNTISALKLSNNTITNATTN